MSSQLIPQNPNTEGRKTCTEGRSLVVGHFSKGVLAYKRKGGSFRDIKGFFNKKDERTERIKGAHPDFRRGRAEPY